MLSLLACLLSVFASALVYLTSDNQRLRATPLHSRWNLVGAVLGAASIVLWSRDISVPAAIFAALTCWMTVLVLLPYANWAFSRDAR